MRNPKTVRLVAIALGLVIASLGIWKLRHRRPGSPRNEAERVAELLKHDRESLANPRASDAEIYGAMVRLAQRKEPIARQEAVKRAKSDRRLLREGAANALGFFDDPESSATLQALLSDADPTVRVQAIRGLGNLPLAGRETLLRQLLARPNLNAQERVAGLESLLRVSSTSTAKSDAVGELVKMARDSRDPNLALHSAMTVVSLAPRDERVISLLRDELEKHSNPALEPTAIRHLSAVQDPWVRKNLSRLLDSPQSQTRLAAVQSTHMACPDDRWSMLEKVMTSERDKLVVVASIQEAGYMPGGEAKALLERMLAQSHFQGDEIYAAKNALERARNNAVDPCLILRHEMPRVGPSPRGPRVGA
jgi:HEAT repeat protein